MEKAIKDYLSYLEDRGLKHSTIENTSFRLNKWFNRYFDIDEAVNDTELIYAKRRQSVATATSKRDLAAVKAFQDWLVEQNIIHTNMASSIKPLGRAKRGKKQLRPSEAKKFLNEAIELAQHGQKAGLALSLCLAMGLRSGEARNIKERDIDTCGNVTVLWIDEGKTQNAARQLIVPQFLVDIIQPFITNEPNKLIFDNRSKMWLIRWCKRICKLSGVTEVTPHGLRGTFASMAMAASSVPNEVASALGHGSFNVTKLHYATSDSIADGHISRVTSIIH